MDYNTTNQILGYVVIPSVDLALPVTEGINKETDNMLYSAVTNLQEQQMGKGNYVLSSHRLGTSQSLLFSPLHKVTEGDKVYITDTQKTYEYTVYKTFLFDSAEVDTLKEIKGYNITTLYTCYYQDGVKVRFGVRAVLTDITPYKQNKDLFKAVIN
ncbi:TPA: class A sortase [Enterococcus faecium]|nr:class A sortase [Enterococcus faecium]